MLYGRDTISLEDVQNSLIDKDVIAKLEGVGDDKQAEGLLVRGRPFEKGSNSKHGRSKSSWQVQGRCLLLLQESRAHSERLSSFEEEGAACQ